MPSTPVSAAQTLVLTSSDKGISLIPLGTALTRLNYFDGKFLRAEALRIEQGYLRQLVAHSNRAGGAGVVHGFDLRLAAGDRLRVGPGLAVDPQGRLLLWPQDHEVAIAELIEKSRDIHPAAAKDAAPAGSFAACETVSAAPPAPVADRSWYVITIAHAEALCGEEDVYGKLCEEACATSTDRPYLLEGIVLRAYPLALATPLPASTAVALGLVHLRSRIASAYYADESRRLGSLISGAGLRSPVWCAGASIFGGNEVALGVLVREGSTTRFLDEWTARRERIDAPPRRYWQWRMAMRPWDVFLAQVLQFQCQLSEIFRDPPVVDDDDDPCNRAKKLVAEASEHVELISKFYSETSASLATFTSDARDRVLRAVPEFEAKRLEMDRFKDRLLEATELFKFVPQERVLIQRGIVELPSAGYLPVAPLKTVSVNDQVRRLMGEGVDLRFCAVRPDFVAHALEEAQHMERISLLHGLDHPHDKPKVDILVPDGEIEQVEAVPAGTGYEMTLALFAPALALLSHLAKPPADASIPKLIQNLMKQGPGAVFRGAGRSEQGPSAGPAFYYAGQFLAEERAEAPAFTLIELLSGSAVWLSMALERNPFLLARNESTRLTGEIALALAGTAYRLQLSGDLQVNASAPSGSSTQVTGRLTGSLTVQAYGPAVPGATPRVLAISDDVVMRHDATAAAAAPFEMIAPRLSLLEVAQQLFSFRTLRRMTGPTAAKIDGALHMRLPFQAAAPSFTLIELTGGQTFPLYTASLSANPDVFRPSHSAHESSLTALRSIAAALKESQFDDTAARRLFPAPRPASNAPVIHARRDWVLFHRRRDKQCAQVDLPPAIVSTRRYRLYVVQLKQLELRDRLHEALVAGNGALIDALDPKAVTVIEFTAGVQTLETPAEQLRGDWQARVGGNRSIAYGAVASQGVALDEGAVLAKARLAMVCNTLAPVTPVRDDLQLELLARVPVAAGITADPHDGVMILAVAPVAMTCQLVYRLKPFHLTVPFLVGSIRATGAVQLESRLLQFGAELLGRAVFREETAELIAAESDDLGAAWAQRGDGVVTHVITISRRPADRDAPTADETAQIARIKAQAVEAAKQVGANVPPAELVHESPEDREPLKPCPAITILVVRA